MTIKELQAQLAAIVARDPNAAGMQLRFGPDITPVHGGIIATDATSLVVLSLAPTKLASVGGF